MSDPSVSPADTIRPDEHPDATTRPWAIDPAEPCQFGGDLQGSEGEWGAYVGETAEPEDAALIVQAVNERDVLLAVGERDKAEIERLTEKIHYLLTTDPGEWDQDVLCWLSGGEVLIDQRERDRRQIEQLTEALERAVREAEWLFQMIPTQAWRDHYGVTAPDGQHEGDYRAEQTRAELESLRAVLADKEDA